MDIKVKAVQQSEAPLDAFGSYSAQINTRSTFGESLQQVAGSLHRVKQRKEKESDALTSDALYSHWSGQFNIAQEKLKSTDLATVQEGTEMLNALDPDKFDFNAYAQENNLTALYDENSFAKYKNRAKENWTVASAVAGIREADRNRAANIKNYTNEYSQEFADNLDFGKGYDPAFLQSKIDYFASEKFEATLTAAGENLADEVTQGHTSPLLEALKHQFRTAKTPAEYEAAITLLNNAKEQLGVEAFDQNLITEMSSVVSSSYDRVNNPEGLKAQYNIHSDKVTNRVASVATYGSVTEKAEIAEMALQDIATGEETYGAVIEPGSSKYLKKQSEKAYLELYTLDEEGGSAFYASVAMVLAGQEPPYGAMLDQLQSSHKSAFINDVTTFVKNFQTKVNEGDPNAYAMISPQFKETLEAFKNGKITEAQFRQTYNTISSEISNELPGVTAPRYYAKNTAIEEFPKKDQLIQRRAYVEEFIQNNSIAGIYARADNPETSAEEALMLRTTAFLISSGADEDDIRENLDFWATAFSDQKLTYASKVKNVVDMMQDDPFDQRSELFNLYLNFRDADEGPMAQAYLKGLKAMINRAYEMKPDADEKEVLSIVRSFEKERISNNGTFRSVNNRSTYIPKELMEDIDVTMNPSLISGPLQLATDKLNVDNGVRAIESAVYAQVAIQFDTFMSSTMEAAIIKDPQLIREFMPDLYDSMTEEELEALQEMQIKYANTGVVSMGPAMPFYGAMKNYLTEDKKREIARGLYFNTYSFGGAEMPISKLEYAEDESGQKGYYVRLLNTGTGKYTGYMESEEGQKLFVSVGDIKPAVKAAKERHTNVGIFRDRSEDTGFLANPAVQMIRDVGASLLDTPSGLFMKDNRFMNAVLDFYGIE